MIAVVISVTGVLGALFVWGLQPRDARDVASPLVGRTLDDWEAPVLERYRESWGETLRYSDLIGRPLVVNVWASWCVPACWNEAPRWKAAWERYGDRVQIVGVDFQDAPEDAEAFLERFDKPFPSVSDRRGRIGVAWGVFGVPETFFIRADGTLSYKHNGEIDEATIEREIVALLEGG
jgi:cytochrome c biogenesis protein CcmG/thiol:disulfide interchange protein DsbE